MKITYIDDAAWILFLLASMIASLGVAMVAVLAALVALAASALSCRHMHAGFQYRRGSATERSWTTSG